MTYQYGVQPQTQQARPSCWGDERYLNPNTRECRSCYAQTSCRDQILRARSYQPQAAPPPPTVAPYYSQIAPQQVPVHIAPPTYPQQTLARQPPQQAAASIYPSPDKYGYGWLTDPMYYQMAASPPPMIPQLDDESFFERLGKNILIDGLRSLTWQLHMATRQWVWAPEQRMEPTDVTPPPALPGHPQQG
jgi:hypothetical protein